MDAKLAAQMLSIEAAHGDIRWWTQALDVLAQCRDSDNSTIYCAFQETVAEVVPNSESEFVELLNRDLSLAQRLFLLAILDTFFDVWICSNDLPEERWLANWEAASEFLIPAGLAVIEDDSHILVSQTEMIWRVLVAAAS